MSEELTAGHVTCDGVTVTVTYPFLGHTQSHSVELARLGSVQIHADGDRLSMRLQAGWRVWALKELTVDETVSNVRALTRYRPNLIIEAMTSIVRDKLGGISLGAPVLDPDAARTAKRDLKSVGAAGEKAKGVAAAGDVQIANPVSADTGSDDKSPVRLQTIDGVGFRLDLPSECSVTPAVTPTSSEHSFTWPLGTRKGTARIIPRIAVDEDLTAEAWLERLTAKQPTTRALSHVHSKLDGSDLRAYVSDGTVGTLCVHRGYGYQFVIGALDSAAADPTVLGKAFLDYIGNRFHWKLPDGKIVHLRMPCGHSLDLQARSKTYTCPTCGDSREFRRCHTCRESFVVPKGEGAHWRCRNCGEENGSWRSPSPLSAAEAVANSASKIQAAQVARETGSADDRRLSDLTMVDSWGVAGIPPGARCWMLCDRQGIAIYPRGETSGVRLPYSEVRSLEVGGPGAVRSGGGIFGGGFGLQGAAEGMLVAAFLNALTTTTTQLTVIRVAAQSAEFVVTIANSPVHVQTFLAPISRRIEAAQRLPADQPSAADQTDSVADIPTQIRELAGLLQDGMLTQAEFDQKKADLLKRL